MQLLDYNNRLRSIFEEPRKGKQHYGWTTDDGSLARSAVKTDKSWWSIYFSLTFASSIAYRKYWPWDYRSFVSSDCHKWFSKSPRSQYRHAWSKYRTWLPIRPSTWLISILTWWIQNALHYCRYPHRFVLPFNRLLSNIFAIKKEVEETYARSLTWQTCWLHRHSNNLWWTENVGTPLH